MESIRYIIKISSIEASNRNSTIKSHENCIFFSEFINLLFVKASKSEHAYLIWYVLPVVRALPLFELVNQTMSHFLHPTRHDLQLIVPLLSQAVVTQDNVNNSCSMNGRIWPEWPRNLLNSRVDNVCLLFVSCHHWETANSFPIEAKVLSIRLEEHNSIIRLSK